MERIRVTVNDEAYERQIEPRLLLVHLLRDVLNLTGTNVGCETSSCGACTVLVDGQAVKSCTLLAVQADGCDVTTIEGLAATAGAGAGGNGGPNGGGLHPLQVGFWEEHGLQCGYCTPGMILAAWDLLQADPDPSDEAIRHGLKGNLCRCTGYQNIVKAVRHAARALDGQAG